MLADIGEGIAEVEVLQWHVKEGDVVQAFDPVCEVQSDKATVEITSRWDGTVAKLHYETGDMAATGSALLDIDVSDVDGSECGPVAAAHVPDVHAQDVHAPCTLGPVPKFLPRRGERDAGMGKFLTTPSVRCIAREQQLDLAEVLPSGKDGRIMKEDVLRHLDAVGAAASAASVVTAPAPVERTEKVRGLQRAMIKTMNASNTIPHFVYSDELNLGRLVRVRAELKPLFEAVGSRLTYMPFFIKAASLALVDHPILNSQLSACEGEICYKGDHNMSVAMDSPAGLIVPNIKQVQCLSLLEIAREMERLGAAAAAGQLGAEDLSGGTFSLSNIGAIGGTVASPIVMLPQVCIGALGRMHRMPRFEGDGDTVVAAHIMHVSWAADHRIVDGATMARFSNAWKGYLEAPETMLAVLR